MSAQIENETENKSSWVSKLKWVLVGIFLIFLLGLLADVDTETTTVAETSPATETVTVTETRKRTRKPLSCVDDPKAWERMMKRQDALTQIEMGQACIEEVDRQMEPEK